MMDTINSITQLKQWLKIEGVGQSLISRESGKDASTISSFLNGEFRSECIEKTLCWLGFPTCCFADSFSEAETSKMNGGENVTSQELDFFQGWQLISGSCDVRTYKDLSNILGVSRSAISKAKRRNVFPKSWVEKLKGKGLFPDNPDT